jgi:hypothetical protein
LLRRQGEYHLHGMIRYTLHLFPVFIGLALLLEGHVRTLTTPRRLIHIGYGILGIVLQIALLILFSQWYWVA